MVQKNDYESLKISSQTWIKIWGNITNIIYNRFRVGEKTFVNSFIKTGKVFKNVKNYVVFLIDSVIIKVFILYSKIYYKIFKIQ